jgi:hypothetical protein
VPHFQIICHDERQFKTTICVSNSTDTDGRINFIALLVSKLEMGAKDKNIYTVITRRNDSIKKTTMGISKMF